MNAPRFSAPVGLVAFCLISLSAAQASWIDLSASWNAQGLGSGWGLVADPVGNILYAFSGTQGKKYNPATNTWTPIASAPRAAYTHGDNNTMVFYVDGKFYMRGHQRDYLSVYDIASDSWTEIQIPTTSYPHSWSQGSIYNPFTKTFWPFWTAWGTADMVEAGYNVQTTLWTTAAPIDYGANADKFHNRGPGVIVGNYYYHLNTQTDQNVTMQRVRLDNWTDPVNAVLENLASVNLGAQLGSPDPGSSWGVRLLTLVEAPNGPYLYVTGADQSGVFAVYNVGTDTWTVLPDYPNAGTPGGYRDHSSAVISYGGVTWLFVQDSSNFWAYQAYVPEPLSVVLWTVGLAGLVVYRLGRRVRFGRGVAADSSS